MRESIGRSAYFPKIYFRCTQSGEQSPAARQHEDLHISPRAHQDIDHSLDAQVITESQSVIDDDGCRTALREQEFRFLGI